MKINLLDAVFDPKENQGSKFGRDSKFPVAVATLSW